MTIQSIEYDATGKILNYRYEDEDTYQTRLASGAKLLVVNGPVDIFKSQVDLTTTPPTIIPYVAPPPQAIQQPILNGFSPVVPPNPIVVNPTPADLIARAGKLLEVYWAGSISVNIGTTDAPIIALADVSAQGRADVLGLTKSFTDGATTEPWYQSTGVITITVDQLNTISFAIKTYVQEAMAVWQLAVDCITSTPPTITTYAQLKALAWPPKAQP